MHGWVYSTPHTLLNALIMSNSYNILEMYDEITENLRISFSCCQYASLKTSSLKETRWPHAIPIMGHTRSRPEILRGAQDDTTPGCHPERREGSLARIGPANQPHMALLT
jgi:hypothetical protein